MDELDALASRVTRIETHLGITGPTTGATGPGTGATGTPSTPPRGPLVPSAPKVKLTTTGYEISADVSATADVTLAHLQIAVRGPGASDTGFKPNTSLATGQLITLSGASPTYGVQAGQYTAWVAYSIDGTQWVDGPSVAFSVASAAGAADGPSGIQDPRPTTGTKAKIVRVGRSGLPWNQLVFRNSPQAAEDWGKARGITVDGMLFFVARGNWQQMKSLWGSGHREWLESGRIIVVTMPVAPESEGDAMNSKGANNAYKSQQRDLAKWYADQGFNRPNGVFRTGWEMNGNWYKWSCNRPGGVEAYRQSIRNYVDNMRAGGLTRSTFTQCWNKGPGQTSNGLEAFAGSQWIDVVGIDQYDMWGPSRNAAQWANEQNKNPSSKWVAELAAKEGIQWSWDEGGNTHGGAAMGGDNPYYWDAVRETLIKYGSNCAWHNTYDERGAPATLKHDFASNPQSSTRFAKLWKPA